MPAINKVPILIDRCPSVIRLCCEVPMAAKKPATFKTKFHAFIVKTLTAKNRKDGMFKRFIKLVILHFLEC